jgi:TRAP transporter TAXI family solute receptor
MMRTARFSGAVVGLCAALVLLAGCTRGPDEQALRTELQEKLARQLETGLLQISALQRQGSSPLPAAEGGGKRLIVYFNATLQFAKDYEFGNWEKLGPSSLAFILGAKEKGLIGIKAQQRAGDVVYAYGSATYEISGDGWKNVGGAGGEKVAATPEFGNTAPPARSKRLIEKLAAMVDLPPPGVGPQEEQVIAEELDRAAENISRRLERRHRTYTFASGTRGGQYSRFGAVLVQAASRESGKSRIRNRETEGSVQNVTLLARGEADYALVQSDVAARAFAGEEPFARGSPVKTLRALGSLFPEPIHVVVAPGSAIREISDLRGKRVDVGMPDSGTRYDALIVLEAYGLKPGDLAEVGQGGPEEAVRRLKDGKLDAFFATTPAPARNLQQLAASSGLRLLSLQGRGIEQLVQKNSGFIPITLPANTYPAQTGDVRTLAAVALLVTTNEAPDAEVERVTELVFERLGPGAPGSAEGAKVSRQTALRGVTIPMHPGASRYLGGTPKSDVDESRAAPKVSGKSNRADAG